MPKPRDELRPCNQSVNQSLDHPVGQRLVIKRDEQGRIVQVIEPCQFQWVTKTYALDELDLMASEPTPESNT